MNKPEQRPWGHYTILASLAVEHTDGHDVVVKKLCIHPGQQVSYQSHQQRHEHWTFVQGTGVVTLNEKRIPVATGSLISIPLGAKHRVTNTHGTEDLIFIEVIRGKYDEEDIMRYQDDYGRVT